MTNEIACAQNSRREVFGLSMAATQCNQYARLRARRFRTCAQAVGRAGSDIVRFDVTSYGLRGRASLRSRVLCGAAPPARRDSVHSGVVRAVDSAPGDVARVDVGGVSRR